jgi:hypothetical protein
MLWAYAYGFAKRTTESTVSFVDTNRMETVLKEEEEEEEEK